MEKRDYYVAIDLGSSSVAVAVGIKGNDGKVEVLDVIATPVEGQGVVRGEIKNIEAVAKSIKDALEQIEDKLGIKIIDTYTGISGQHIRCAKHSYFVYVGRDGEIRDDDVQKLAESMRNVQAPDGDKILMILPQSYTIDDQDEAANPIGMFGKKLEATFNFIIGNNATVSRLEKALMKVDLKQRDMLLNPLVCAEAIVLPDEKEMGVVVLDIGAGTTDMCIYADKMVRHVAVIPIGADSINKDIRAYGILERYVEDLKVQYGSAITDGVSADKLIKVGDRLPREISFKNLASIVEARMQDILDYVVAEIKRVGFENRLAAGMVITGGGAKLKDLDVLIKNYTGYDVRVACADISVAPNSLEIASNPEYATVIGILLEGMKNGTPNKVEVMRRIISQTDSRPSVEPVVAVAPQIDGAVTEEPKKDKKDKQNKEPKKSPFKGLVDKFSRMFDVIDDEI